MIHVYVVSMHLYAFHHLLIIRTIHRQAGPIKPDFFNSRISEFESYQLAGFNTKALYNQVAYTDVTIPILLFFDPDKDSLCNYIGLLVFMGIVESITR